MQDSASRQSSGPAIRLFPPCPPALPAPLLQLRCYRLGWFFSFLTYSLATPLLLVTLLRNVLMTFYIANFEACLFYYLARQGGFSEDTWVQALGAGDRLPPAAGGRRGAGAGGRAAWGAAAWPCAHHAAAECAPAWAGPSPAKQTGLRAPRRRHSTSSEEEGGCRAAEQVEPAHPKAC